MRDYDDFHDDLDEEMDDDYFHALYDDEDSHLTGGYAHSGRNSGGGYNYRKYQESKDPDLKRQKGKFLAIYLGIMFLVNALVGGLDGSFSSIVIIVVVGIIAVFIALMT